MKKAIRVLSLLLVLAICFSLCGCNALDELRESRASIMADGTIKLPDGTEYKLLPACKELYPDSNDFETVYISPEELPLLLTVFSEESFIKSNEGMLLYDYDDDRSSLICYCRSDVYDNLLDRIKKGFTPEACGYWYYDFDNEEDYFYTLTKAQEDAVFEVYRNQTPQQLPEAASLDYESMANLMLCTSDKLFMQETVSICILNEKYYVVDYEADTPMLYTVPDNLNKEFAAILKKQIESDSYWNEEW